MKRPLPGKRCNVTGENIFNEKHLEVCVECQNRVWRIKHPKLEITKWICFGTLIFLGIIGFLI